jgi:hypothetical protein
MKNLTPIKVLYLMFLVVIILAIISLLTSCASVNVSETQYDKWDTIYQQYPTKQMVFEIELDTVKVPYKLKSIMIPPK